MDASIPIGMEDLLLLKSICSEVCTGARPGRDPIGPNRLDEKPCRAERYISESQDSICERSVTCIRLHLKRQTSPS